MVLQASPQRQQGIALLALRVNKHHFPRISGFSGNRSM